MSEFKREPRYYVIKRKSLDFDQCVALDSCIAKGGIRLIEDCLVVESDWPEYEPTWLAIQDRVDGIPIKSGQGEAVAEVVWPQSPIRHGAFRQLDGSELEPGTKLYTAPPDTGAALDRDVLEMMWLEQWLLFVAEPVGQECCNRPGSECCGCPDACYRTADDIAAAMNARREELRALLAKGENP